MPKLVTVVYVPPPRANLHPQAFLDNLGQFKRVHPLILFSDHSWPNVVPTKANPEVVARSCQPARLADGSLNKWVLHNLLFFTACRLARKQGATHMLYLESDCRVGRNNWDATIFDEFLALSSPAICGGTLAVWNPQNKDGAEQWKALSARNTKPNFPVAGYGPHARPDQPAAVYPIGALAMYDMTWIGKLFDLDRTTTALASECTAFDLEIGRRIWREFGAMSYDVVGWLNTVYSGPNEGVTTEEERVEMLRAGKYAAVHPIKSGFVI